MAQPEIADSETGEDILIPQQFICKDWTPSTELGDCGHEWNTPGPQSETVGRGVHIFHNPSW